VFSRFAERATYVWGVGGECRVISYCTRWAQFGPKLCHPTLLAREAATIDVLSGGRFEFGIGTGYDMPEYSQTGITLPPPRVRVERLRETLAVVKGPWSNGPLSFSGEHYAITEMEGWPKPLQEPRPPIQVGGGGRRMLALAAQEADIVGIIAQSAKGGGLDFGSDTDAMKGELGARGRRRAIRPARTGRPDLAGASPTVRARPPRWSPLAGA
jgi:alkanesulfonate monooxygenase SsuD/methylene tetrahydromethanopterin reductase-like flavin-dependent oxidoreductase (luciferase family)